MGFWLLMLWVSSMQYGEVDAFFDWLKKAEPAPASKEPVAPVLPQGDVPAFEMSVGDEKFLAEAKQMELSPLDSCHFQVCMKCCYCHSTHCNMKKINLTFCTSSWFHYVQLHLISNLMDTWYPKLKMRLHLKAVVSVKTKL